MWAISLILITKDLNEIYVYIYIYIRDMTLILNIKGQLASLKGKGEKRFWMEGIRGK